MPKNSSVLTLHRICITLVAYTVLVIIWGAWVRISHSGDGCGTNWPLCDGVYIPNEFDKKTFIEYFHRLSSGLYGIFVLAIAITTIRIFPRKTAARQFAVVTFFLMIIEALLGAALVLKGLVGENATIFRLVVMTMHQVNSLLLTGSTVILAVVTNPINAPLDLRVAWKKFFSSGLNCVIFMIIPATGAWAALANTLFPSRDLSEGLAKDLESGTPWILKLRVIHPVLALGLGFYLAYFFFKKSEKQTDPLIAKSCLFTASAIVLALVFGILTLLFLSPVWMKLTHLALAQGVWITLVYYVMISLLSTSRYKT